jgi:hypothetical protein
MLKLGRRHVSVDQDLVFLADTDLVFLADTRDICVTVLSGWPDSALGAHHFRVRYCQAKPMCGPN